MRRNLDRTRRAPCDDIQLSDPVTAKQQRPEKGAALVESVGNPLTCIIVTLE